MTKLRIAVIGAGRLGGFHAQKLAARKTLNLWRSSIRSRPAASGWPPQCHTRGAGRLLRPARSARCRRDRRPHESAPRDRPRVSRSRRPLLVEKPLCTTAGRGRRVGRHRPAAQASCSRWATSSGSIRPFTPRPTDPQSEVHRGRPHQRLHLPLDRRGRGAGS